MWFNEQVTQGISVKEIILNFMPSWWCKHYGIGYGEPMIFDYKYRVDADREMRKCFYERFGRFIGAGTADPQRRVVYPDWDNTYYQAMMGFDVRYLVDQYPMSHGCLSDEEVFRLKVPDNLWDVYPFNELARQTREMNSWLNADAPLWMRTRGILNEAIQLCGSDFYGELLDEDCDEKRDHLFRFIMGVIEQQLLSNQRCNPSSGHIMMNCTVGIAGARAYGDAVYAYDKELYDFCLQHGMDIGLHHCGKFDDFVDLYAPMTALNFIEIGHTSKIKPVLDRYPNADVQYIVDTSLMREGKVSDVLALAEQIKQEIAGNEKRFHISVADLEHNTPDENVVSFVEAFRA